MMYWMHAETMSFKNTYLEYEADSLSGEEKYQLAFDAESNRPIPEMADMGLHMEDWAYLGWFKKKYGTYLAIRKRDGYPPHSNLIDLGFDVTDEAELLQLVLSF